MAAGPMARLMRVPLVTVVIPCYNQAQYLPDAVASVVAQAWPHWELIIVNDGSTDRTGEVARELIVRYPERGIRLVEQPNTGTGAARNRGLREGAGEYFLPLDADDRIAPSLLEKAVAVLDSNPFVGFVYSHIQHFGLQTDLFTLPEFDAETLVHADNIVCVCSLVRRAAWQQVGGYREDVAGYEDWDFWVACVEKGWRGHRIPEPLFYYRKHGVSALSQSNHKRDQLIARIVTGHPDLYSPERLQRARRLLQGDAAGASAPRVLLACTHFWPSVGGLETVVEQLGARLVARGYDVDVATLAHADRVGSFRRGVRILALESGQDSGQHRPVAQRQLRTLMASGDYQACVLFADPLNWILWSAEDLAVPASTRMIAQPLINADGYSQWRDDPGFGSRLARLLKRFDAVVAITRDGPSVQFLSKHDIGFVYVPNGSSPPAKETGFRQRHGIPDGVPLLLHVANLWRVKNHLRLMEALRGLPGDWRLVMIGHPSEDQAYAREVKDAAAADRRFLLIPGLPRPEIDRAIEAADLVCLASLGEVSPVVILEAMSHGKPWIATPACLSADDCAGGIVVALERFPETVHTLMAERSLAVRMGDLGRAHWEACFTWERVVPAWEQLIATGRSTASFDMPGPVAEAARAVLRDYERALASVPNRPAEATLTPDGPRDSNTPRPISTAFPRRRRAIRRIISRMTPTAVRTAVHSLRRTIHREPH
jgi:glycosyltransferase involved in cell wall biosynthesis